MSKWRGRLFVISLIEPEVIFVGTVETERVKFWSDGDVPRFVV